MISRHVFLKEHRIGWIPVISVKDGVPGATCRSYRWHNLEDAIDSNIFRSIFMKCEEFRNHYPFLEHTGDNANFRNIVDQGLKLILFLSPKNRIAHRLSWNITSHKLPDSLERAFSLIQYPVFGSVYYQMLQRTQSCIFISILFSIKMTHFTVIVVTSLAIFQTSLKLAKLPSA